MSKLSVKDIIRKWSITTFLIFFSSFCYAAGTTYTSQGSGDWDTSGTWDNGVPGMANNDVIIISSGHSVTKTGDLTTNNNGNVFDVYGTLTITGTLTVQNNLVFNIYSGGSVIITNISAGNNADLTINGGGTATVTGDMTFGGGADITVEGDLSVEGSVTVGSNSVLSGSGDVDFGDCLPSGDPFCSMGPLPVKLIFFHAEQAGAEVKLDWSTASEVNNDFFTIARSRNGKNFDIIATVQGNGTMSIANEYQFTDKSPYFGISYYRLSQTDYDGSMEQFPIISVLYTPSNEKSLSIHPNPIRGEHVQLRSTGKLQHEKLTVRITNLQGRLMKEQEIVADEFGNVDLQIDLQNLLRKNTYIIELISNSEKEFIKVVGE